MELLVDRMAVHAGDDMRSHEKIFTFPDDLLIEIAIERIVASGYLAQVGGGCATWVVYSGSPVGVVAQQWARPCFFRPIDPTKVERRDGRIFIDFVYEEQKPPEEVFASLMREIG